MMLAFIANGRDEIAFRRMINKPARGIGAKTQDKLISYARSILFTQDLHAETAAPELDGMDTASGTTTADFVSVLLKNLPNVALSKKAEKGVAAFLNCIHSLRQMLSDYTSQETETDKKDKPTLAVFVSAVIEQSGLGEFYKNQDEAQGTQRAGNLEELLNAAGLYDCTTQGLSDFLEHIELDRSLAENEENADAVQLITIHNTKGLEFRNVILTGLENSIFPRDIENEDDLEEERRLMYVACTRAQDNLYMTSCSARRLYGRLSYMQPSLFLSEIEPDLVEISGVSAPSFSSRSAPRPQHTSGLWKKGKKIYHEDYGYGVIIESRYKGTEHIIMVEFETGCQMKFFPAYQHHDLFAVNE